MRPFLAAFRRYYTAAALCLLHILVLLVLLNLLAYAAYKLLNAFSPTEEHRILEKYEALLPLAYPHLDAGQIRSLMHETWNRRLEFAPFVQFREPARSGQWVNVSAAGFRSNGTPQPWPPSRTDDAWIVFVFGGSTTFGYGVADNETIPARLQHHLSARTSRAVEVYNFGTGFWYSSQERILFQHLLQQGHRPDLAIFIDGLNDLLNPDDQPEFTDALAQSMQAPRSADAWKHLLRNVPILRLSKRLAASRAQDIPADTTDYSNTHVAEATIERYLACQSLIRASANAFETSVLFVWQPLPFHRYDAKHHLFATAAKEFKPFLYAKYGYARMSERLALAPPPPDFLDLSGIQEHLSENLYVDAVHYNALLCDLIAQHLADALLPPPAATPAAP